MKRIAAWMLVLLVAGAGLARAHEGTPAGTYKIFVQDGQGRLSLVDATIDAAGEVVGTTDPVGTSGGACNGGTCETPRGAVLTCPPAGGPICGTGEVCHCQCTKTDNGTWTAVNRCAKP